MAKFANKVLGVMVWAALPWPVVLFCSGWGEPVADTLFDPHGYHPVASLFLWALILSPAIGVWRLIEDRRAKIDD